MKSAEILKRAKTDAGCYEGEKYQSTVTAVNKLNVRNAVAAMTNQAQEMKNVQRGVWMEKLVLIK